MNDTSPAITALFREQLMKRSPEERFVMGARMFESAREIALASFPQDLSAAERLYNIFIRYYGREFEALTRKKIKQRIFQSLQASA